MGGYYSQPILGRFRTRTEGTTPQSALVRADRPALPKGDTHLMKTRKLRYAMIAFLSTLGVSLGLAVPAYSVGPWTDYAFHPSIANHHVDGRAISDLAVHNNELYMGYGNYSVNTGPIDIATVDLLTGATAVKATANTEEINNYRNIDGFLYAPWIDTKDVAGIFSSNKSGSWLDYGRNVENIHIYDVAKAGNGDLVAVGSANSADRTRFLGATAFVSKDGGKNWNIGISDLTAPKDQNVSGYERFYWAASIGGKVYMQVMDTYAAYGRVTFPIRVYDGKSWRSINKSADCFVGSGNRMEVFEGKAYCGNGRVFDGRKSTTRGAIWASDFYQYNGSLYALSSGSIKMLSGNSWVSVATVPSGSASLAVTGSHYYVGTNSGHVLRATR